ncbi:winged helix-turn-helix transcriptional regulator [[Eubacterium] cellulosolvens]
MSRDKVALENQIRKMIYTHIVEYPGVSFSTLKRFHDLNEGTLRYHLNYLERAEKITSKLEAGKLHYYPFGKSSIDSNSTKSDSKTHELTPHQELILNAIKQNPGINQTELIAKTSLKRHILTYNISQLIDLGIVKKNNHVRHVSYEYMPDELLQYEMLKMLTIKLLNNEIDEQTFLKLRSKLKKD